MISKWANQLTEARMMDCHNPNSFGNKNDWIILVASCVPDKGVSFPTVAATPKDVLVLKRPLAAQDLAAQAA
jgi:hypothetical protein